MTMEFRCNLRCVSLHDRRHDGPAAAGIGCALRGIAGDQRAREEVDGARPHGSRDHAAQGSARSGAPGAAGKFQERPGPDAWDGARKARLLRDAPRRGGQRIFRQRRRIDRRASRRDHAGAGFLREDAAGPRKSRSPRRGRRPHEHGRDHQERRGSARRRRRARPHPMSGSNGVLELLAHAGGRPEGFDRLGRRRREMDGGGGRQSPGEGGAPSNSRTCPNACWGRRVACSSTSNRNSMSTRRFGPNSRATASTSVSIGRSVVRRSVSGSILHTSANSVWRPISCRHYRSEWPAVSSLVDECT